MPPFLGPHWALVWATIVLCVATIGLAYFTAYLFWTTRRIADEAKDASKKALDASTTATETLIKTERPYLTGGGDYQRVPGRLGVVYRDASGNKYFSVDVANYGKTPAFLTHYDVRFAMRAEVQAELLPVCRRLRFDDRIAGGDTKPGIDRILIDPPDTQIVYGAFWYQDWQRNEHFFRFILNLAKNARCPMSKAWTRGIQIGTRQGCEVRAARP